MFGEAGDRAEDMAELGGGVVLRSSYFACNRHTWHSQTRSRGIYYIGYVLYLIVR